MKSSRNTEPGFTLLELLASMAVLSVMIVMLFAAFSQASRAWLQAENRVETFTQGRVALDLMARELSQAIATTNISFLGSATSVAFIAPISTSAGDVDLEEVVYQWTGGTLVRQVTPASAGAALWDFYTNPKNWPATTAPGVPVPVADNVVSLSLSYVNTNGTTELFWNSTALPGLAWSGIPSSASAVAQGAMTNRPPAGVLIAIDTIDSRAAARLQAIITPPGFTNASNITPYTNLINQVRKSFTTFVAIPNGQP
jgi:prepilin-type N-terminal cleavage/methylation domain-containing protein